MRKAIVRRAEPSDASAILEMWEELSDYYRTLDPIYLLRWTRGGQQDHRSTVLSRIWDDEHHYVAFVAQRDGVFVGFCRVERAEHDFEASIHNVFVRATERGHGTGAALMHAAVSWCTEHGVEEIVLDVLASNVTAAAFHRSLGFEPYLSSYVKRLRPSP